MAHFIFMFLALAVWIIYSIVNGISNTIRERKRRTYLLTKYEDLALVERLMARKVWAGQSEHLLIDSFGRPDDIDQKVLKTKRKEVWKYCRTGHNRYRNRITLENGYVVGWDLK